MRWGFSKEVVEFEKDAISVCQCSSSCFIKKSRKAGDFGTG